ncbi:hypothetical protein HanHA300_Chr09g0327811 [Helianthus annuus]|nr:hypothetical protein HanHA300_Chr09g0327811 [Helianthus annuus]KAJ0543252.1 hypothetical protein HanHA89_Chr09g0348731 [Helianthus annuus]KAJ0712255.1 hypothetical protein HanOQP8_Chr09g0332871 [Helianthus annuus]
MANGVRGSNEASMNRDIKGAKEEGSNTRKSESSQDRGTLVYTAFLYL